MLSLQGLLRKLLIGTVVITLVFLAGLVTYAMAVIYPPPDGVWLKNGEISGGDFLAFYTGGTLYCNEADRLYDLARQVTFQKTLLGGSLGSLSSPLPFIYPPLVAAFFCPLSHFAFERAFYTTAIVALLCGLFALFALSRQYTLPFNHGYSAVLLATLGFMPFYLNTVFGGQLAWLGIVIFASFAMLLLKKQYVLSGAVLALGYYKPPLFVLAALYFAIRLGWPFIKGGLLSALVLSALSVAAVGIDGLSHYVATASTYTYGQEFMPSVHLSPSQGAGVFALTTSLLSISSENLGLYFALCISLLALSILKTVQRAVVTPTEIALVITASVGLSVWCMKYDLAILLVPFLLFVCDFQRVESKIKYAVIILICGFYVEYWWREETLFGVTLSLSSVLFLLLIAAFYSIVAKNGSAPKPSMFPKQLEPGN